MTNLLNLISNRTVIAFLITWGMMGAYIKFNSEQLQSVEAQQLYIKNNYLKTYHFYHYNDMQSNSIDNNRKSASSNKSAISKNTGQIAIIRKLLGV